MAVISFCMRSAIPGYMVVPPDRTVLAYRSFLMSTSHFPPLGTQLLPCSSPQLGGPVGDGLPLQVGPGHHVPQQHGLQGFLVLQKFVERINWNLIKG